MTRAETKSQTLNRLHYSGVPKPIFSFITGKYVEVEWLDHALSI